MEYDIRETGQVVAAHLKGRLTFTENVVFREVLRKLEASKAREWLLDLSGVDFIDSAGLGLLIIVRDFAEKAHATLRLKRPSQQAERLFEVAKLGRLFTIEA